MAVDDDHEAAGLPGPDHLDQPRLHQERPVDTYHPVRGQPLREPGYRRADEMIALAGVQPHVITLGLRPADRVELQEREAPGRWYGHRRAGADIRPSARHRRGPAVPSIDGPPQRLVQALLGDRLRKVVDRANVEGVGRSAAGAPDQDQRGRGGETLEYPSQLDAVHALHACLDE